MPLPLSRNQIEKLGKRLVAAEQPAAVDVELLNEILVGYRAALSAAVITVERELVVEASSRVKTRGTTMDKLRLNGGSWLSSIQDLAGMRVVGDFDRNGQDVFVERLVELFANESRAPKVVDRRETPSSGYRAVHVVVFPDGVSIEVQVRTRLQHEWAELFEKLADRVGRAVRYGQLPPPRWASVAEMAGSPRAARLLAAEPEVAERTRLSEHQARIAVVDHALSVAESIASFEEIDRFESATQEAAFRRRITAGLDLVRNNIEEFRPTGEPIDNELFDAHEQR